MRWAPTDAVDATLSYYLQLQDSGGRNVSSHDALGIGKYEAGMRVMEPNARDNQLLALEVTTDLGFAELTSATGYAKYREHGHRDQTDLLITLEYSYEAFPSFTAFTHEKQEDDTFTQELRLVSNSDGPLSWIVGGFYKNLGLGRIQQGIHAGLRPIRGRQLSVACSCDPTASSTFRS